MNDSLAKNPSLHPIRVVAMRTGIPQDLIRAWERRYQAVVPERSETGRRVYTDQDVERLKLLKRVVGAGRRISDVADLDIGTLKTLIAQDMSEQDAAKPTVVAMGAAEDRPAQLLAQSLLAIENLDRQQLEKALADAAVELSAPHMRQQLIVPLLYTIGERWRDGSLRIVQEHMASAIVRSTLSTMMGRSDQRAPKILITTPAGQHHELGALMAAAAAVEAGWNVEYLGPDLPAEEIAAGVRHVGAQAVALSVVYRDKDLTLQAEIQKLRSYLDPDIPIFIGGRAVMSLSEALAVDGAVFPRDMSEFQDHLASLGR
jgi:MerR family transcriptional regulator, light-induced transcriptional regulator